MLSMYFEFTISKISKLHLDDQQQQQKPTTKKNNKTHLPQTSAMLHY